MKQLDSAQKCRLPLASDSNRCLAKLLGLSSNPAQPGSPLVEVRRVYCHWRNPSRSKGIKREPSRSRGRDVWPDALRGVSTVCR